MEIYVQTSACGFPHTKSLACCGLADFGVRIGMDRWVDGWDWLVVCWGMMWTLDSYGVGCIHGV